MYENHLHTKMYKNHYEFSGHNMSSSTIKIHIGVFLYHMDKLFHAIKTGLCHLFNAMLCKGVPSRYMLWFFPHQYVISSAHEQTQRPQTSEKVCTLQNPQTSPPGEGCPAAEHSSRTALFTTTVSFNIRPASSRLGGSAREAGREPPLVSRRCDLESPQWKSNSAVFLPFFHPYTYINVFYTYM